MACVVMCMRFVIYIIVLGLMYPLWHAATLPYEAGGPTFTYDPAVGASLDVQGCDVHFVSGTEPTIIVEANQHVRLLASSPADREALNATVGATVQMNTAVLNEDAHYFHAKHMCLATIYVPEGLGADASFNVTQGAGDFLHPRVKVTNLTLPELSVSGAMISAERSTSSITKTLTMRSADGGLRAHRSSFGDVDAEVEGTGSIHLLEVAAPRDQFSFSTCTS